MASVWIWNSDFIVFKRREHQIILKNDINGALVSLSPAEYEALIAFSVNNSLQHVKRSLKNVHVEEDTFVKMIEHAKDLQLLQHRFSQAKHEQEKDWQMKLHYIGMRLGQCLSRFFGKSIFVVFHGNIRFFKCFSISLDKSFWQTLALSKTWQKCYWPILILLYILLIVNLIFHPKASFAFSGFAMTDTPVMALFAGMIVSIFACLFCHELGHYFVYKRYDGEGDIIGIGCMFVVFPVMFTQIDDSCWWQSRKKRILLSLAGVLMDGIILLALCNLLCFYHHSNFLALLIACLFYYYVVQILTNLNPFFPGSDGYYLMEDLFGWQRCYGHSWDCAKKAWKALRQGQWPSLNRGEWIAVVYFCLAALCISLYWLLITGLLSFPLWSNWI